MKENPRAEEASEKLVKRQGGNQWGQRGVVGAV